MSGASLPWIVRWTGVGAATAALALGPAMLRAQARAGADSVVGDSASSALTGPAAGERPPGAPADTSRVIRGIVLDRVGVFDPGEDVGWLARVGNSLHTTTRRQVVRRELLVHEGEPFDSARVAETARNLRALGIFRRVFIDSVRTDSGLVLRVTTKDGWSTRPQFDFSSAGGQTAWSVGLEEVNLFGNAAYGALSYADQPDRSTVTALFRQPRLFASRVYLQAGYQHRSDGRSISLGIGQPFLNYSARWGASLGAVDFDGDVLRFFEGSQTASIVLRRRYALLRFDGARALAASPRGFVRVGMLAQLRRDDFVDLVAPAAPSFPRTVTAAAGPYIWLNRADYLVVHNYRSFLREEDVDLSPGLIVGAYAAPKAFGYERGGVGLQGGAQAGLRTPGGFVAARAAATALYTSAGLDSGSVRLSGNWLLQPSSTHALSVAAQAGWLEAQVPGEEFDLGLSRGPRAFYQHAFTGDRMVNLTAEYRWTAAENLWEAIGIGLAAFVDHGGAWYSGAARRTGTDFGFGLRLGPSRTTSGDAVRIDLARRLATDRQRGGWVLVIGSGARY
ncbi:MAG TPA: hypothetical protein VFK09_00845 [Gemmatimonadales bacterium]|nr:hypothetical protein [Gemmatimonadales bacterium]